jgi:methanogenic corrinoid protein MtbC1
LGQASALPVEELRQLVSEDADSGVPRSTPAGDYQERAFLAVADLAPERLQVVLRTALLSIGTSEYLDAVVVPLLRHIGVAWHDRQLGIAHEHAASAVLRAELAWLVNVLAIPDGGPRAVVATLVGERHELGAILAAATAVHEGWRVTYLGLDLPAAEIAGTAASEEAGVVGVSVVLPTDVGVVRSELEALRRTLPAGTALLVGGAAVPSLGALGEGITAVRDLPHWRALLRSHAPAASG